MKSKLLVILFLFCLNLSGQISNNETFTLQNVVTELDGVGAIARVDKVTKDTTSGNCTVGCNGYSYQMTWNTTPRITVGNFVTDHSGDFGTVSLVDNGDGSMTFSGNLNFAAASITPGYGTAVNITPYDPGSPNDLADCFDDAVTANFDLRYHPYYLVTGNFLNAHNSLINFRNYKGASKDGIPIPVATDATNILYGSFSANGKSSVGGSSYYIDVSEQSNFSTFVTGYENYQIAWLGDTVLGPTYIGGLGANIDYYYRFRAGTLNGTSGNSNTITLTTDAFTSNYHDWRMATISELSAMRNVLYIYSKGNFVTFGIYWSDQAGACDPPCHFAYHFGLNSSATYMNTSVLYVRAVRSFVSATWYDPGDTGQGGLVFNGTDNGNGTYTWYECTPVDLGKATWSNAETLCNNL